jgi:hypothetical protein
VASVHPVVTPLPLKVDGMQLPAHSARWSELHKICPHTLCRPEIHCIVGCGRGAAEVILRE